MRQPIPAPPNARPNPPPRPKAKPRRKPRRRVPMWALGLVGVIVMSTCAALTLAGGIVFGAGRVPLGVSSMGVNLSLMSRGEAANALNRAADTLTLYDDGQQWTRSAAELGILLDAQATIDDALQAGWLSGGVSIPPTVSVNTDTLRRALESVADEVTSPAQDATLAFNNGQFSAVAPQFGRALDVDATVRAVSENPADMLRRGVIVLAVRDVPPAITDAAPLVNEAQRLLAGTLNIRAYDPLGNVWHNWNIAPQEWGTWLIPTPDNDRPLGLRIAPDPERMTATLQARAAVDLQPYQRIETSQAVETITRAIVAFDLSPVIRVYENDRTHTVQSGESITSIAWDYGIPYPYLQQANPNASSLNAGMSLTIPSRDVFMEFDPVPNKRIVVSINGQWTKVYENDALLWEWTSSTGIADSPTWPGVYQILSHEPNAYAGNWDLYMPWFMGIYKPIPGSDFTNGFHGFPTRGGGQLLWENSLGQRVTYGCVLLHDTHVQTLYNWAENGVIVEILP